MNRDPVAGLPYCILCQKQFTEIGSLRRHAKEHHGNARIHTCPKCGWQFKRRYHLVRHMKNIHKVQLAQDTSDIEIVLE